MTVAAVPLFPANAQTPACQAGAERAASSAPLLVEPIVNGVEREVIPVRYVSPGGPLYIGEHDLKAWDIAPDQVSLQSFSGARWLCVESLGLKYRLDPKQLTLALDFPTQLYGGSRRAYERVDSVPVTYGRGGFFNYDLRYESTKGDISLGASWEIGAFARPGVFTSSFISANNADGTIRLDTTLRRDDPVRITSTVAGDTITRAGSLGASVRMGGLQYQTNFATAPLLTTYPSANVAGTAVVPSTVDVFIGNARAYSTQVTPGPFSLANLPVPVGAGNVRVVVRDIFGKETTAVVPYVRYDAMLKQGLHDFSYEAGVLRNDYAVSSNAYGSWAAVATHRYGVTDRLTIEGHAEGMADRGSLGGLVQMTVPVLGLVGAGGAVSGGLGNGRQGKAFFARREPNWSVSGSAQQRSSNYVDIAFEPQQINTLAVRQAAASVQVGARNSLNALWLHTRDQTGDFNTATLGWTVTFGRSGTLTAGYTRFSGSQPASRVFSVLLAWPLGERDYATASFERRSNLPYNDVLLNMSRNLEETNSFGYRILAGEQSRFPRQELGAFWQTGVGQFGIEAADGFDTKSVRASARGGIALAGGEVRLARYLDQSFAIVKVADFPGVQITANSQPVGKTDAGGVTVVPRLTGFLPNAIAFDGEDIPLEGSFGENVKQLKIPSRMGVVIDMGVLRRLSATLTLTETGGKPVPAGASVRIGDADEEFPVARQGRVYVSGLGRGKPNILNVRIGERTCRATIEIPGNFTSGETLGSFTCQ